MRRREDEREEAGGGGGGGQSRRKGARKSSGSKGAFCTPPTRHACDPPRTAPPTPVMVTRTWLPRREEEPEGEGGAEAGRRRPAGPRAPRGAATREKDPRLPSAVSYLLSSVPGLPSPRLLSSVPVSGRLSSVSCLLSLVSFLLSSVPCPLSPVSVSCICLLSLSGMSKLFLHPLAEDEFTRRRL